MTRIIAGTSGGRRLATPPGAGTRPTSDRVREALFSRLEHLDAIEDVAVLDLYAGSGALGQFGGGDVGHGVREIKKPGLNQNPSRYPAPA